MKEQEPRRFGFRESVVYAALAALTFTPLASAFDVRDGTAFAVVHMTLAAALYVVLLGLDGAQSLVAVGGVLAAGFACSFARTMMPAAVTLTAALCVARSWFVLPRRFAHPFRTEVGVAALSWVVVVLTVSPSFGGVAIALWGFFLAQSAYFLLPSDAVASSGAAAGTAPSGTSTDSMDGVPVDAQEVGGSR